MTIRLPAGKAGRPFTELTFVKRWSPVSYTHLDVYKRQILPCVTQTDAGAHVTGAALFRGDVLAGRLDGELTQTLLMARGLLDRGAVSYTHLKRAPRRARILKNKAPCPAFLLRPNGTGTRRKPGGYQQPL